MIIIIIVITLTRNYKNNHFKEKNFLVLNKADIFLCRVKALIGDLFSRTNQRNKRIEIVNEGRFNLNITAGYLSRSIL